MRQVEQIMGMPITIDIDRCDQASVFDKVFTGFHKIDERFSTYKPGSEVSRYASGELKPSRLSDELKLIIDECQKAGEWTNGYFSAWASGAFDPSGYVKGWAIATAGDTIKNQGYGTYCISAGGDILAMSNSDKKWNIAIQDPTDKTKILNMLSISNGAVATSGNYERGAHIINPKSRLPADELLSVTIIGPDIIKADILATACFAMGSKAAAFMKSQKDYQALIIPRSQGSNR
jgi:thiamine biosynthesis lipoprotein